MDCLPVILVVKAPNQQIDDQSIECRYDWTVKRVKQQISCVYPSKPKEDEQKLIYSGKLLRDDALLKDVLKKYDDEQTSHTLHLVCSQFNEPIKVEKINQSKILSENTSETNLPSPEGLRHRVTTTEMPFTGGIYSGVPSSGGLYSGMPSSEGIYSGMPSSGGIYSGMPFSDGIYSGMPLSGMPSQWNNYPHMMSSNYSGLQWSANVNYDAYYAQYVAYMQQVYSYQMARYTQIYQTNSQSISSNQTTTPDGNNEELSNQQPAAEQNNERREEGQIRMNAQGGAMLDDGPNRDWLDRLYTLSRFAVLLSIVYFYSSFNRFLFVSSISMLLYLYHIWWQRLRQQENNVMRNQPQPHNDVNIQEQAEIETTPTENDHMPHEEEAPRPPTFLRICWTFISSFFLSLFPQLPLRANEN